MTASELTAYERVEIQMSMVVPLLRDLQAILGEDVVLDALAERHRRRVDAARSRARRDVPFEKRIRRIERDFASFAEGDTLEYASLRTSDGGLAIDVSACRFAELMAGLDARDLGSLLLCGEDEAVVAGAGTCLKRSQTRMQGASHCDFRFRDDVD
jgi:predicted ArsR family transcriptional regulator